MVPKDEWRRTWLDVIPKGAVFCHVARYVLPRSDWDHEHCELCFEKIGTGGPSRRLCHGGQIPLALPGMLAGLPGGMWMDIGGR